MKKLMVTAVAVAALSGFAFGAEETKNEAPVQAGGADEVSAQSVEEAEVEVQDGYWNNWRITVGGFGRGNMRAKVLGLGSERVTAYGVDLDVQYNVWQNRNFNIWAGIGGTFCPQQNAFDSGFTRSTHAQSSEAGTTIDTWGNESATRSAELAYGDFRLMLVPEWKITEQLALGARIGVAFDWIRAELSGRDEMSWRSHTVTDPVIPGFDPIEVDLDGGNGDSYSDTQTEFAAQAILGLQATYMFTDWVGLYANFDWRLGGETTVDCGDAGEICLDMSGWYWGAGVVVSF